MFKYLVVYMTTEPIDPEGHFDGSIDECDAYAADTRGIVLCKDVEAAGFAIKAAADHDCGCDWALYEVVGDKTVRRAITFESDGTVQEIS